MLPNVTNARLVASVSAALMQSSTAWPTVGPKPRWPPERSRTTLREPSLRVDSHANSSRVGDNDAAFGVFVGGRDLHRLVLPLHLYRFGIPLAESKHLVHHVDNAPRLQVG